MAAGFKLLKNNDTFQGVISDVGVSFDASDDTMTACEAAICMLYGKYDVTCFMQEYRSFQTPTLPECCTLTYKAC